MKTTKLDKHAEIEEKEILHFVEKSNEKNYKGNPFQKLQAVSFLLDTRLRLAASNRTYKGVDKMLLQNVKSKQLNRET